MEQTFLVLLLISAVLAAAAASPLHQNASVKAVDYRLPKTVQPIHYKLKLIPLQPDLDNPEYFGGEIEITVKILETTDTITLHYNDLKITEGSLTVTDIATNRKMRVADMYTSETQFYFIRTVERTGFIKDQEYLIKMLYTGYHKDDMYGFYRSSYKAEDGKKTWLATTQFEATHARRAFPCFDEPGIKATFEISIQRQGDLRAISNMPLKPGQIDDGWDHFETTPKMSTYLVAFIVSDFEHYTQGTDNIHKIWARKGAIEQAKYSYSISHDTISAIEEFLQDYKYEMPKMDQVAIPDFSSGAMENWGICTYRERLILYNEDTSNAETQRRIATVVAHEFAHQWFGDLVSPEWWNYLWLNEGFATYFETFATHEVEKNWQMEDQFVVREVHSSMDFDSLESTHPITHSVESPNEIRSIFDAISYEKAGSVIRMMEHFVTTDVFKKGLNIYLTKRHHDFANEDHLYQAMEEAITESNPKPIPHENVQEVMYSWTRQAGHPVVTVSSTGNNQLTLKQERFYFTKTPTPKAETLWKIPITYEVQDGTFSDTTTKLWLKEETTTITKPSGENKWHIFNVQEIGYYRVNYDEANWKLLIDYLNSNDYDKIHVVNRAQLLNDALSLARAGVLDYGTALDVTRYLHHEKDYIPWYSALTALSYLKIRIAGTASENNFKQYILNLLHDIYNELEFNEATDDSHIKKLHRGTVLQWACEMDHDHCVETARTKFSELHGTGSKSTAIPADLQSVVYCTAVRHGGATEWDHLWQKYVSSNFASEQTLILTALGCTRDQTLIDNYLEKSIVSDGDIRRQDASSVFASVYANPSGVEHALDFLERKISDILQFYGTGVSSIISGIAARISTQQQFDRLDNLVKNNDLGMANEAAKRAVETARDNLQWYNYYEDAISAWLENELQTTTPDSTPQTTPITTTTPDSTPQTTPITETDPPTTPLSTTTDSSATFTLSTFVFVLTIARSVYIFINY